MERGNLMQVASSSYSVIQKSMILVLVLRRLVRIQTKYRIMEYTRPARRKSNSGW